MTVTESSPYGRATCRSLRSVARAGDGLERSGTGRARTTRHRGDERHEAARPGRAASAASTRSRRPRARTSASPMPPMTSAIPSPKATTRTNPNAGRPAAIEPSRISSALVDGISPPARPRTNRLRHDDRGPGRRQVAVARRRRGCGRPGPAGWSACPAVVVVVVVVVRVRRARRRARAPARAIARPLERASGDGPRRSASSHRSPRSRRPPRPAPT